MLILNSEGLTLQYANEESEKLLSNNNYQCLERISESLKDFKLKKLSLNPSQENFDSKQSEEIASTKDKSSLVSLQKRISRLDYERAKFAKGTNISSSE